MALVGIGGHLRRLERAEDAASQLQRVVDGLHTGRECREVVVAEVGLLGAGSHDEAVERRDRSHGDQLRRDGACLQVDRFDLAQQHLDVLLLTQDEPGGRSDFALGEDSGGHLVEQWLEQVSGRPRNET